MYITMCINVYNYMVNGLVVSNFTLNETRGGRDSVGLYSSFPVKNMIVPNVLEYMKTLTRVSYETRDLFPPRFFWSLEH